MTDDILLTVQEEPDITLEYVEAAIKPETVGHVTPKRQAQTVYPASGTVFGSVEVDPMPNPVLQNTSIAPTKQKQTVTADSGFDGLGTVEVEPIPSEYIIPQGKTKFTQNGTFDVSQFAEAEVSVSSTPQSILLETVDISSFSEQVNRITIDATKYDLTGYMMLYAVGESLTLSASDWLYLSDNGTTSRYLDGSRTTHNFIKLFYVKIADVWRGILGSGTHTAYPINGDTTPLNQIIFYTYSSSTKFTGGRLKIYAI